MKEFISKVRLIVLMGMVFGLVGGFSGLAQGETYSCWVNLISNTTNCAFPVTFIVPPAVGKAVAEIDLTNYNTLKMEAMTFNPMVVGTSSVLLNIGDSISNNGWCGDAANQSNDAEFWVYDKDGDTYPDDMGGCPDDSWINWGPFFTAENVIREKGIDWLNITLSANKDTYNTFTFKSTRKNNEMTIFVPGIFCLDCPDSEGPPNSLIYVGINRSIYTPEREAVGIYWVKFTLIP